MTLSPADLAAYRDRIGWHGDAHADRATLETLVAHHTRTFAFENLDPLTGRVPDLTLSGLVAKLVHAGRGGYCYEQNGLFKAALESIGFDVTGHAARVMWNLPEEVPTGRTHMVLRVELPEGPVIADVGFGSQTLTGVLDLVDGIEQATPHGPFRLIRGGDVWRQEVSVLGEWRPVYAYDLQPQLPIDYELANWWSATSPRSHFLTGLIVARATPGRRSVLRNFDLTIHHVDGPSERRHLESPTETCDVIETLFDIRIPDRVALEHRLEEIAG